LTKPDSNGGFDDLQECAEHQSIPQVMSKESTIHVSALKRARDLSGGVTYLARKLGIDAKVLDAMMTEKEPVPKWLFMQVVQFITEAESTGKTPPGFPEDWEKETSRREKGTKK
jgi:hypothetical protein